MSLPSSLPSLCMAAWLSVTERRRVNVIARLLNQLPTESTAVITSADTLLTELFSHRGEGGRQSGRRRRRAIFKCNLRGCVCACVCKAPRIHYIPLLHYRSQSSCQPFCMHLFLCCGRLGKNAFWASWDFLLQYQKWPLEENRCAAKLPVRYLVLIILPLCMCVCL